MSEGKNLQRLVELARRSGPPTDKQAPFGFATRVAARAFTARERDALLVWESLSQWALIVALIACVVTVALPRRALDTSALADFAGASLRTESNW